MKEIKVNLDNLTNEEREILLKLVEKGNKKNKKRERPEYYHFISDEGSICRAYYLGDINEIRYRFGNYFKTKEEAELAKQKQLIHQKLKDYALEHNEESINWENPEQNKWFVIYNYHDNKLITTYRQSIKFPNIVYFTLSKKAQNRIRSQLWQKDD